MTSLILGASGQVGQALILELEKRAWSWEGTYFQHPEVNPRLFQLDLGDAAACAAAVATRKPNVVFLPSGWTWVDGCEDDPARAHRVNALAPEAVAKECKRLGAALVYYSTEYVFGEHGGPYSEKDQPNAVSIYGQSKLDGERLVLAACPDALALRTTVVYGPEPQGKNFIYQLIKNLKDKKSMTVPNDQLSSPTYNRDLARASVELVELAERGVWNVAGSEVVDRYAFAKLAAATFDLDSALISGVSTASMKQKARRPLDAGLRIEKLVEKLGWKPKGPLEGLQAMKAELERDAHGRS
jgi:dTDP-4-dehydrorhamnose reductase